jgi:MazG family protein
MKKQSSNTDNIAAAFTHFVEVIAALRHPQSGCPWDLEQTHRSLRPYLIEESYEVLEAIESGDDSELALELGDVLLQVVLHAQIARERSAFDIEQVIRGVCDKMIRRHPHVFGETTVKNSAEVLKNWEQIKLSEGGKSTKEGVSPALQGVPAALPALLRAQRLGEKASKHHFDWSSTEEVWKKVYEELRELEAELPAASADNSSIHESEAKKRATHELGDLLFALCQTARFLGINAEDALREGCDRFTTRFTTMEQLLTRPLEELNGEELEAAWQEAKKRVQERVDGAEKKA